MLKKWFLMLAVSGASFMYAHDGTGSGTSVIKVNQPTDSKSVSRLIEKNLSVKSLNLSKDEAVAVRLYINKNGDVAKTEVLNTTNPDVVKTITDLVQKMKFRYVIVDEQKSEYMEYNLLFKLRK
jgi:uncharacterized protein (DUF362 family)